MLCVIIWFYVGTLYYIHIKLQTSTLLYTAASVRENPNTTQAVYDNYNRYKTLQRELIIYLMATIMCQLFGVIASVHNFKNQEENEWIRMLYCFFSPLQGFVNTFLFFNSSIRKRIKHSQLCSKWNSNQESMEYQPLIEPNDKSPILIESDHRSIHSEELQRYLYFLMLCVFCKNGNKKYAQHRHPCEVIKRCLVID